MSSDTSSSTESSLSTSTMSSTNTADDSTPIPSGIKSPTSPSTPPTGPSHPPTAADVPPPIAASTVSSEPTPALKPPIAPPTRKVSGALLKASMSALSSEETSFPRLLHSLPLVLAEVNNGVDSVRKVGEFVEKIARAKQAYAAACLQALQEVSAPASLLATGHTLVPPAGSRPRSSSNSGLVGAMPGKPRSNSLAGITTDEQVGARFLATWKTLRDVVHAEAISDLAGSKAYHETVAEPLLNYHRELTSKAAIVTDHASNMISQLRQSQERLLQNKIGVLKLVESQRVAEERERQEKEEKEKGGSGLAKAAKELKSIGFLFKSKDKQMTEAMSSLSSDELREQAYQATILYQSSVEYANTRSTQYFDHDVPTILAQLQQMETTRLETLRLHLETLSQHLNGLMAPADKRVASFTSAVQAMSTKDDINDFVELVSGGVGVAPTSRPNQYKYDLQFTADDIKHNRVPDPHAAQSAAASLPSSYFGTSLDACQRLSQHQAKGTDVPFLVVALCERIRKGGKPVFTAVVDLDDVLRARSRLDAGEASIGSGSGDDEAELAAAVLKMWLRDLDPRLISGVHYDAAIGLAKTGEVKDSDAIALYHSLPPLHQAVLYHIASTLASVSVGGTMDSVATTLAPHLMQSPHSSDPATALADINYQVKLVSALLAAVANQSAPAPVTATSTESTSVASTTAEASSTSSTSVGDTTQQASSTTAPVVQDGAGQDGAGQSASAEKVV